MISEKKYDAYHISIKIEGILSTFVETKTSIRSKKILHDNHLDLFPHHVLIVKRKFIELVV